MTDQLPEWTPKPWGGELLLRKTEQYAVKVLHLQSGCRTSLQYHRVKQETMFPGSGRVLLETHCDEVVSIEPLAQAVLVPPGTVHRLIAETDAEIVEVSGTELDDVVRLEDDYGRVASLARDA